MIHRMYLQILVPALLLFPLGVHAKKDLPVSSFPKVSVQEEWVSWRSTDGFNRVSPDGTWAWSRPSSDNDIAIVDPDDNEKIRKDLKGNFSLAFVISPDSNYLFAGRMDGGISMFDKKGNFILSFVGCPHESPVYALAMNQQGDLLNLCMNDKRVYMWDTTKREFGHWKQSHFKSETEWKPMAIAMSINGQFMAIADRQGNVLGGPLYEPTGLYDLRWTYQSGTEWPHQLLYSPDGKYLLVYRREPGSPLLLLNSVTGEKVLELGNQAMESNNELVDFQFSPDGKRLIGLTLGFDSAHPNQRKKITFDLSALVSVPIK